MTIEIKVPDFPESVADGTLVAWHKRPGEAVARDEVIADIETDKVVFEVPSPENGVIEALLIEKGAVVESGMVIARLVQQQVEKAAAFAGLDASAQDEGESGGSELLLTPSAKRLINEKKLDPKVIHATGKGKRLLKEDVLNHLASREVSASPGSVSVINETASGGRPETRVPMTRLRARIAERLLEAQRDAAILTTFNEANMQPVMELRQRYRENFEQAHGAKLGLMSFFVKAVVEALRRFPEVNASIDGNDIVYHGFIDIGIAVSSPRGLVVPIIRDVDQLTMAKIEQQIAAFAESARDGSLTLDEITGGTFSITNGGVFGSLLSTPIINPPQSAILGIHKIEKRPVVIDDEIVIRPMMNLALSYDHRIIDGREAVQFLVTIKQMIEDPARLLLEV
jgi:2-oxoglutarate dehydrogenase E2 component (dihydrolipoamide succinyltransferase)